MVSRKRGREEMESSEPAQNDSMLTKLRSMWEFSNIMQYIFIFGRAVKIDENFTIEVFLAQDLRRPSITERSHGNPHVTCSVLTTSCVGSGDGVSKTRTIREATRDWAYPLEKRFVASRTDVSILAL